MLFGLMRVSPGFKALMQTLKASELMSRWLAKRFFGSYSIEHLEKAAYALGAQTWLIQKVREDKEWRNNCPFVHRVLERYTVDFYRGVAVILSEYAGLIDMKDDKGNTPLMNALLREDFEAATFLLSHNAARSLRNNDAMSVFDIAESVLRSYAGVGGKGVLEQRARLQAFIERLKEAPMRFALNDSYAGAQGALFKN